MRFSINGLECSCQTTQSNNNCKLCNLSKVEPINNDKENNEETTFPYTRSKIDATKLRASHWSEFLTSNSRTEHRLFIILKVLLYAQIAVNLALIIIHLIKGSYVSGTIIMVLGIFKAFFGISSSNSNGRRHLGLLSFFIILWESWATFHVTLLLYTDREESLNTLVNSVVSDLPLLITIIIFYGVHLILSIFLISLILIWYLSPAFNNSSWDLNSQVFHKDSEKGSVRPIVATLKCEEDVECEASFRPQSDVPTIILDQRLDLINPKSLENSPNASNLEEIGNKGDPYLNNLKYQIKVQLLKRYSEPFKKEDSLDANTRWSTGYNNLNKKEFNSEI